MADLDAVVASAMKTAQAEDTPETTETAETTETVETTDPGTAEEKDTTEEVPEPLVEGKEPTKPAAKEPDPKPEKKVEGVADDELDISKIPAKEGSGRENRIPHSRVVKIANNAVKKALAPVQAELDTAVRTHSDYKTRVEKFESIMLNDKPRFIEMLRKIDGYSALFDKKPDAPAFDPATKMPEPDADLGDGKKGYSPDGVKALMDWVRSSATAEAEARAKKALDERFSPIEKERKDREDKERAYQEDLKSVDSQLAEMADWEGFKEHEAAILKALHEDTEKAFADAKRAGKDPVFKYKSVRDAYRQIVLPTLKADRLRVRKELIEELKKAPVSTSTTTPAKNPANSKVNDGKPRDLDEVVREAMASIK